MFKMRSSLIHWVRSKKVKNMQITVKQETYQKKDDEF